jgi:dTDP-4-dehydrorhamnose reductase
MFLIVGGDSEIGAATYRLMKAQDLPVSATTRRPDRVGPARSYLDLSIPLDDWLPPQGTRTACVCAAAARLIACADHPQESARINVAHTLTLINKLVAYRIYVLFLSTNQVFDGREPNVEANAAPSPVSEYGRQKAQTETSLRQLMTSGAPVGILRLAKVLSPDIPLLQNWIKALKSGNPIRTFHDVRLAPVPIELVCRIIIALMMDRAEGVFQLTGPLDVTYTEVAHIIARQLGADPNLISSISAREAGLPEGSWPLHTTLDSHLLSRRYQLEVPDVQTVIHSVVANAPQTTDS